MVASAPTRPRRKAASKPVTIGPTWQRNRGGFVLPKRTLGWQIIGWCAKYLLQPDGLHVGEPWKFTDEQSRFLLWWYAVDADGQFVYRRGTLRRMKGWGKDPFAAVLCAVEFVGPSRYAGEVGCEPVGAPHPAGWVQVAAVALDQTRTTMTLFPGLFSKQAALEFQIDLGKEIIYAHRGRARIEALTTSSRTQEGPRPTFAVANETHHWLASNDGHSMRATMTRNLAKTGGRMLGITNAHNPGEDSIAEQDYAAYLEIAEGRSRASGFLYDALEAPPDTVLRDPDSLRAGLLAARGDSWWLDVDRLMEEIYDPQTPPSTARRFYLDQIVAAEDAWVAPHEWDSCAKPDHKVPDGAVITLGLDGSKSNDHTALVGCEVETGHLFLLGHWDPATAADGVLPRDELDATVHQAFGRYDVVGFYSDRQWMETLIDKWAEEFTDQLCVAARVKQPIEWDMGARTQDITKAVETFHEAVTERVLTHDGNETFRQHVINARNRPNNYGMTFAKESAFSPRKVDALAAAVLARLCRQDYLALPEGKKRRAAVGSQIWI